ncbi:MAG: oxidoreductase [Phycisphaeraceae bacterium]|nr:MAG: oxidoreductase [Phycisphaeraceae bacterium]
MSSFTGKTILVTGATSGIGRDTAITLAQRGAKVAFTGRRADRGKELEAEIKSAGGKALFIQADAANEDDTKRAVEETVKVFGGLHGAFNNAGIEGQLGPSVEATHDNYRRVFDINVWGVAASMKHEIPAILATVGDAGGGSIVNNSSAMGVIAMPNAGLYAATKHAVIGLSKAAALEVSAKGVRVNVIAPAVIETEMFDRFSGGADEARAHMTALHPIGRIGQPREITGPVLWLLSDESSFVTGQTIAADGGFTAQ